MAKGFTIDAEKDNIMYASGPKRWKAIIWKQLQPILMCSYLLIWLAFSSRNLIYTLENDEEN